MVTRDWCFKFTDEEYERLKNWAHENKLDGYHGAVGGAISFEITPTSIGEVVEAFSVTRVRNFNGEYLLDSNGDFIWARDKSIVIREI